MHRYQCRQTSPPPPINHRSMEDHYTSAERSHPLLQSVIHLWKTTTLQQFHGRLTPLPPPINNRSMQDHYTNYISHIDVCTYTSADRPHSLLQSTIDLCKTTTPVQRDPTPPPIDRRSMQDHYTNYISHIDVCTYTSADRPHPLLQSTIDLWKTTTLHQFNDRLTPPPPPIEHRSLADHYTDYVAHIAECTDTSVDRPHPSSN